MIKLSRTVFIRDQFKISWNSALTLIGIQIATVNKSATARLPRNRFVGPFKSLDIFIDNIIKLLP